MPKRDYLIGAAAAEMPLSWPDEALKAQIVAAHSYALYCRDHASAANGSWLSADPARRQGYLTDAVLHSYWGTDYEANYARLSALADAVLSDVLCYDGAAAGTSYFALSNGRTEASENVWGSALPYLVPVDSSTDLSADNYEVTLTLSAPQVRSSSFRRGWASPPTLPRPERWFGETDPDGLGLCRPLCPSAARPSPARPSGGLWGCGAPASPSGIRTAASCITTQGYGHGVGLSQWGAKGAGRAGAGPTKPSSPTISRARSSADDTKTGWSASRRPPCVFLFWEAQPRSQLHIPFFVSAYSLRVRLSTASS